MLIERSSSINEVLPNIKQENTAAQSEANQELSYVSCCGNNVVIRGCSDSLLEKIKKQNENRNRFSRRLANVSIALRFD
jgi:hypothetical protein